MGDNSMVKIDNEKRMADLPAAQYKELLGVDKPTFDKMYGILQAAYKVLHIKGGKPPKLSVLDKLVITLGYWREYRTYRNIAFDYGVGKSAIGNSVIWVEDTLIKDGAFSLPSKREMQRSDNVVCVAVVDVTEQEIERPQKNNASGIPARKSGTRQKPC
jgi:hypothetical protein